MTDRITVGMATCGLAAGAQAVYDRLKSAGLNVEKVGCIGMCYNEPVVTVIQDGAKSIYHTITEKKVDDLIEHIATKRVMKSHLAGRAIDDIDFYKRQRRLVMANCGNVNPGKIQDYFESGGYKGLQKALDQKPEEVIEIIKKSGLRGRGGAGFPTGLKWSFIAKEKGEKILIGNGDEGDPGAFMNRTLMESDPFRIIEGMTIGAYATGCSKGYIYTRAEYPLAIKTLQRAIDIAYSSGYLGKIREDFSFDLEIMKGAGAFVCGEETALIHSIEGKRGSPTPRPPYPAQHGVHDLPTNVNNVGTWGHVTTIMQIGADEYKKIGTKKTSGTKVICLTGKVQKTGIVEIPMGTTLHDIIYKIGGGPPKGSKLKAALSGGPAGGCIPNHKLRTQLDYEEMRELGSIMGSGGLVAITDDSCIVDIARFFMNFTQEESCGKCTPCREGTKRLLEMLESITQGKGDMEMLLRLKQLAEYVQDNSLCGLGQAAPNPILSTLRFFEPEYKRHIQGTCPAGVCTHLTRFEITDRCIGCGTCKKICPVSAISGMPKEHHEIDQKKCIKCGSCHEACPVAAITK